MSSNEQRMTALARTFPTLQGDGVPGITPWDPESLQAWALKGGVGSGSVHAVRFLLAVWNFNEAGPLGAFNVVKAMCIWDARHRAAFAAWVSEPWTA